MRSHRTANINILIASLWNNEEQNHIETYRPYFANHIETYRPYFANHIETYRPYFANHIDGFDNILSIVNTKQSINRYHY